MKVGLLTYHFSDNYGALYQAYGLRQWLNECGHDADFVNYHPTYVEEGGALDRPWKPSLWRKNATIAYMKLSHLQRKWFGEKRLRESFDTFRRDYLGVTGPRIKKAECLRSIADAYDVFICGSDQIWNPSIQRGLDPVYFCQIPGGERAVRVSFAPSFGRTEIEPAFLPAVRTLTEQLDGLSVREPSGAEILKKAGVSPGRIHVVPDPTILLGSFPAMERAGTQDDRTVFCYALRTDEVIRDVAEAVAAGLDVPLVSSRSSRQRWRDIGTGISPGPVEWLQRLANAEFVVSNSFHGVALSILHNKPFLAVGLPGAKASLNARVEDLLEATGLSDRLIDNSDDDVLGARMATPIDWVAVNAKLAAMKAVGEDFLAGFLAEVPAGKTTADTAR